MHHLESIVQSAVGGTNYSLLVTIVNYDIIIAVESFYPMKLRTASGTDFLRYYKIKVFSPNMDYPYYFKLRSVVTSVIFNQSFAQPFCLNFKFNQMLIILKLDLVAPKVFFAKK